MGDSSLSKQGLGLGHRAKRREIFSDPRTNSGRDFRQCSRFENRADNGRFYDSEGFASTTYATRGSVAKTFYFPEIISCLGLIVGETGDSGHNSCLDGSGRNQGFPERFSGEFQEAFQIQDQGVFRASFRQFTAFRTRGLNSSSISWSWLSVFASA